jgi:hypothetical protein
MTDSCFMIAEHIIRPTDHKTYRAAMRQRMRVFTDGKDRMLTPVEMQTSGSSGGLIVKCRMKRTARLRGGSE